MLITALRSWHTFSTWGCQRPNGSLLQLLTDIKARNLSIRNALIEIMNTTWTYPLFSTITLLFSFSMSITSCANQKLEIKSEREIKKKMICFVNEWMDGRIFVLTHTWTQTHIENTLWSGSKLLVLCIYISFWSIKLCALYSFSGL